MYLSIILLICSLITFTFSSAAESGSSNIDVLPDYSVSAQLRSYQQGGALEASGGIGFKLWEIGDSLYGLAHPKGTINTSMLTNSVQGQIEFFPLQLFGVFAGRGHSLIAANKFQGENCQLVQCKGRFDNDFWGAKGVFPLPYYLYFYASYYEDHIVARGHHANSKQDFLNMESGLVGAAGADTLNNFQLMWGGYYNSATTYGIFYTQYQMKVRREKSSSQLFFFTFDRDWAKDYLPGNATYSLMWGNTHSRTGSNHLTLIISLKWDGLKGLGVI